MNPHRVRINNEPLNIDLGFNWSFRTGVQHGGGTFTVPIERVNDFVRLSGTGRRIEIEYHDESSGKRISRTISNVTLSSVYEIQARGDELVATFTARDLRWTWPQRRLVGHFGLTRRTNDLQVFEAGDTPDVAGQEATIRGGLADVEPTIEDGQIIGFVSADVIGQGNPVPITIYRPLTLDWSSEDFDSIADQPKPWTAYRAVLAVLRGYWIRRADGTGERVPGILSADEWGGLKNFEGRQPDNGYPLARQSHIGTPLPQVLADWMMRARISCTVWYDGKLYIHPIDLVGRPELPSRHYLRSGGRLVTRDPTVERPQRVRVGYRIERENLFGFSRGGTPAPGQSSVPGEHPIILDPPSEARRDMAVNVIRLPAPEFLDVGIGRREYPAGTYLPIEPVLREWGISSEWLEKHWFLNWPTVYQVIVQGEVTTVSQQTSRRIVAIQQSFRRLYQISTYWIQQILDMSADSVVLLDPITGSRQPVPVWSDFAFTRNRKIGSVRLREATDATLWQNQKYERSEADGEGNERAESEGDPGDHIPLPNTDEPPSPFVARIVDPVLGLVAIEPASDLLGVMHEVHQGSVVPREGDREITVHPSGIGVALHNARLDRDYGLAFVTTMMTLDPNSSDQLYWVEIRAESIGARSGSAPVQEIVVQDETARIDFEGNVVNDAILKARATAEARSLYEAYNPILFGRLAYGGIHELYPFGTASAVMWQMAGGQLTTVLDMPQPPVPSPVEAHLSQQYRDYVLRLPRQQ